MNPIIFDAMAVDQQTLKDLEFDTIRMWLNKFSIGETANQRIKTLSPITNFKEVKYQLDITDEFLQIKTTDEVFPRLEFEELLTEIKLLPIKNSSIQLGGFMKIHQASSLVNSILVFFDKRTEDFPLLSKTVSDIYFTTEIVDAIEKIFDSHGKVKDDASIKLYEIRTTIKSIKKQINRNFDKELRKLLKDNILGDTRESFVNDRRVLTISSSHKRKVPGAVVGSSNTGSYTYIEPAVNVELNNEYELLLDDERKEIFKILQGLKIEINTHIGLIKAYQVVLTEFDFINSKTKLAISLECVKPSIVDDFEIELTDAYHPILFKNNQALNKKTHPQHIHMDKFSRMLVISGPNAGGKSITLKTIGLLQVMLQSGLLVPVNQNSKMCFFEHILSDIGDNQSIENELSTYSYRLKRMKHFLDVSNKKTFLLIDEFGTGSDPDLGGALAESIFEALYSKKCFGVITTHYANIKLKANQLKNAINGCMLFNIETLEPLYKFTIGQPGSSFTFEVATINGISEEIIENSKGKLDNKKVKMDRLLSELQKEKTYLSRLNKEHIEAQENAQKALNEYIDKKEKYDNKLQQIRNSSLSNERYIQLGNKMAGFIDEFNIRSRKKTANDTLMSDAKKYFIVEKSKLVETKEKKKQKDVQQRKVNKKKVIDKPDQHQREKIKVGSSVKLISTKQSGIVEEIKNETVTVIFGFARMKVELRKLSWVN